MTPQLTGIDHLHIYVANLELSEKWYGTALGLQRDSGQDLATIGKGPLMLSDATGSIHLALFQRDPVRSSSVIAFGATGENFLHWKSHLTTLGLPLRVADHETSFSLYFDDPDDNTHEITSYEHGHVAERLN